MPIIQMLKEAREAGKTEIIVDDGVYSLRWVDPRTPPTWRGPRQIWMFVPCN